MSKFPNVTLELKINPTLNYESFRIDESQSLHYLPTFAGTSASFGENLKRFVIEDTGLKVLTSDNLKPFKNLRALIITSSLLELINGDVFRYSKKLEYLSLRDNYIRYVQPDVFKPLVNLEKFDFDENVCFEEYFGEENAMKRGDVEKLFIEIEKGCTVLHHYKEDEEDNNNEYEVLDDDYADY